MPVKDDPYYYAKIEKEIEIYREVENVHDLPDIAHYWNNKFLLPILSQFGFQNTRQFFSKYAAEVCSKKLDRTCRFVSIGSGNCEVEVALAADLRASGYEIFVMECVDLNPHMLERGNQLAAQKNVADKMLFTAVDINDWVVEGTYDLVIAYQSLHHFVELEMLFDKIYEALEEDGYFLTHDMIGRNGHMRWPEALDIVNALWKDLPNKYKYNHQLKRLELEYENWDCSKEGFEGIRAQDILPLLAEMFNFELFIPWGGVLDIFIDRGFGHNYDPNEAWDRAFINKVYALNVEKIVDGSIKPTQMIAAMTKQPVEHPRRYMGLTPEFCLRKPDA